MALKLLNSFLKVVTKLFCCWIIITCLNHVDIPIFVEIYFYCATKKLMLNNLEIRTFEVNIFSLKTNVFPNNLVADASMQIRPISCYIILSQLCSWSSSKLELELAPHICISISANLLSTSQCFWLSFKLIAVFSDSTYTNRSWSLFISANNTSCPLQEYPTFVASARSWVVLLQIVPVKVR